MFISTGLPALIGILLCSTGLTDKSTDTVPNRVPPGLFSCVVDLRLAHDWADAARIPCITASLAKVRSRKDERILTVKKNASVTFSCGPFQQESVDYWTNISKTEKISEFRSPDQETKLNFGRQFIPPQLSHWVRNGDFISPNRNCSGRSSFACRVVISGDQLEVRHVTESDAGLYVCIGVEDCILERTGGRCRLKHGQAFRLVVGDLAVQKARHVLRDKKVTSSNVLQNRTTALVWELARRGVTFVVPAFSYEPTPPLESSIDSEWSTNSDSVTSSVTTSAVPFINDLGSLPVVTVFRSTGSTITTDLVGNGSVLNLTSVDQNLSTEISSDLLEDPDRNSALTDLSSISETPVPQPCTIRCGTKQVQPVHIVSSAPIDEAITPNSLAIKSRTNVDTTGNSEEHVESIRSGVFLKDNRGYHERTNVTDVSLTGTGLNGGSGRATLAEAFTTTFIAYLCPIIAIYSVV